MRSEDRGRSSSSSRIVALHAAVAGLCPLIPVPFADDLALRRVVRRMYRSLYAAHGRELPRSGAEILRAAPTHRLRDALAAAALYPVKKIVRKVVYVLAVKECAEVASAVFHDGWLLARVLEDAADDPAIAPGDPAFLRRVRAAMLQTYEDIDPAPLRRALAGAFSGARVGVRQGVEALRRALRRQRPADDVDALSAGVRAAVAGEGEYVDRLERTFRRHLGLRARGSAEAAAHAR
jgi:uncharacterized protein (DUF697 family)